MREKPPRFLQPCSRPRDPQAIRGIDELREHGLQARQRPVDADAGIAGGNAQHLGNFAVAEVADETQLQYPAVPDVESPESMADDPADLVGSDLLLRRGRKVPWLGS